MSTMTESVLQALRELPPEELEQIAVQARETAKAQREAFWPAAKEAIENLAAAGGVTPAQLFQKCFPPAPREAKYISPDGTKKWSGAGKKPKWLAELQEQTGLSIDHFEVGKPPVDLPAPTPSDAGDTPRSVES